MIKIEKKGYHDFTLDSNSEMSWFESDQAGCAGGRCSMQPLTAILRGRREGNRSSDQALSVVARGGQDSAGDIQAEEPHQGAVVVELTGMPDLKSVRFIHRPSSGNKKKKVRAINGIL